MKRTIPVFLILTFVLSSLVVPEAGAGWLDKFKKKEHETKLTPRYDLYPTMSFHKGVLRRGAGLGWLLDGAELEIRSGCRVTSDFGDGAGLEEGQTAIVMGPIIGETINAYRVRIVKPEYMWEGTPQTTEVTPSEVDPTVGVITGGPR